MSIPAADAAVAVVLAACACAAWWRVTIKGDLTWNDVAACIAACVLHPLHMLRVSLRPRNRR